MRLASELRRRFILVGGVAAAALVLASGPAAAQWRAGQGPGLTTSAATLEGYARMIEAAGARLRAAHDLLVMHGTRETQEASMPPAQQALLDEAQTAWMVVRNAPAAFDDRDAYEAADRQFGESIAVMRLGRTSPAEAAAEAREILRAMAGLQRAATAAAQGGAATGAGPSREGAPVQGGGAQTR